MKNFNSIGITALLFCILLTSCNNQSLRIFKSSSARTQYLHTLETSGIANTKIGTEWQNSASEAVLNAAVLEIPVAIQGNFLAKSIEANAWKIQLDQGASVNIWVDWQARDSSELIVDLLAGPDWTELESFAAREDSVTFEADRAGNYILRIQPELLGEGNFQVRVQGTATYAVFPVQGKNSRAIQSIWGDVRDGGRRSHEGVDIFAPRGTPVLAPVAGVVTSVRDQGLGGKQVWVRDVERSWHLYFAHLDSQLVSSLQRVAPGDTLGLVGNTGNARTTAPHLHFGIYQNGAINPFPAVENIFDTAPELTPRELDRVMTVTAPKANLRSAPSTQAEVVTQLADQTPVFILAATRDWYQIHTADGLRGFLSMSLVGEADPASLPKSEAVALTNLDPLTQDALLIQLDEFVKIGSIRGYDLIRDADENILYLPTEGN